MFKQGYGDGWSYWVLRISISQIDSLQKTLNNAGRDGWQLVSSVSTNGLVAAVGDDLVFVLKKLGHGYEPPTD